MKRPASYSLRRRLVWLLTATVAAIWLVAAAVVYRQAHHEADQLLDAQLMQVADTLLAIVSGGEVEHFVEELQEHADRARVPIAFEIWYGEHGPMERLVTSPGHGGFQTGATLGFSERVHQASLWRFYAVEDHDKEYRVIVGQAHAAREKLARSIGLSLLLPAGLALILMALAVWAVVGRSLRPVEALAREVGGLDAQALAPLGESAVLPNEIAPVRAALNALIHRVNQVFENERRFAADAAHELRTPLAALKVQAQVALRAQTDEGRQHALSKVIAGVDRMTHLVEQLLTLARVDPANFGATPEPIDPAPAIAAVCADLQSQVERRQQTLSVDAASECRIAIASDWLQIALRNLIDNASRYAGEGAHIEVKLVRDGTNCVISVADDGPGVAPELRAQIQDRFVRGEVDSEGCGLGLSIVARIAALSGARLALGDGLPRGGGGRGFAATLRFRNAADSPSGSQ
ncbi:MAG TPA: histidine kinase dimerization/phospho-acceptor domain-containing protein [Thiobacillaceae bacterium]|nr:histidine kinase dimerization/phospho-acceptor domain-containing protein [Thiobacillaceae bacterium]